MLKKGAIRKVQPSKGEFVSNIFLVKKNGGQRPVKNLKQLNAYIPYCHFNGMFAKTEILVAKRRLLLQPRFKRCIFFGSLGKKLKSICSFPLVRKLVRVPLILVWFGTNTTNIHKIAKSANDNFTQDEHQNDNLLRRHAIDWSLL